jgi:hypothetical protein
MWQTNLYNPSLPPVEVRVCLCLPTIIRNYILKILSFFLPSFLPSSILGYSFLTISIFLVLRYCFIVPLRKELKSHGTVSINDKTCQGSRLERSLEAVSNIGPAVFNGGFTTFLALALLGFSTSQIFLTFFKVKTLSLYDLAQKKRVHTAIQPNYSTSYSSVPIVTGIYVLIT